MPASASVTHTFSASTGNKNRRKGWTRIDGRRLFLAGGVWLHGRPCASPTFAAALCGPCGQSVLELLQRANDVAWCAVASRPRWDQESSLISLVYAERKTKTASDNIGYSSLFCPSLSKEYIPRSCLRLIFFSCFIRHRVRHSCCAAFLLSFQRPLGHNPTYALRSRTGYAPKHRPPRHPAVPLRQGSPALHTAHGRLPWQRIASCCQTPEREREREENTGMQRNEGN